MVITLRTDIPVALKLWTVQHSLALNAFLPQTLWHIGTFTRVIFADARG